MKRNNAFFFSTSFGGNLPNQVINYQNSITNDSDINFEIIEERDITNTLAEPCFPAIVCITCLINCQCQVAET